MTNSNNSPKKIIVAFHTGRGGRFNNAGHVTFIGEHNFQHLIALNESDLCHQNRDEAGRFCKPYFTDCSGNRVDMTEDLTSEVGYINSDNEYDCDSCAYLEDCSEDSIRVIIESNEVLSIDLENWIAENYPELLAETK